MSLKTPIDFKDNIVATEINCNDPIIHEAIYQSGQCHPSFDQRGVSNITDPNVIKEPDPIVYDDITITETIHKCDCDRFILDTPNLETCLDLNGNIILKWNGIPCATAYEIYRDGATTPTVILPGSSLHYVDIDITDINPHTYTIRALRYTTESIGLTECTEEALTETNPCLIDDNYLMGSVTGPYSSLLSGLVTTDPNGTAIAFARIDDTSINGKINFYFSDSTEITTHTTNPDNIWTSHTITTNIGSGIAQDYPNAEETNISYTRHSERPLLAYVDNINKSIHLSMAISKDYQTSSSDWVNMQAFGFGNIGDDNYITELVIKCWDYEVMDMLYIINDTAVYYAYSTDLGTTWNAYQVTTAEHGTCSIWLFYHETTFGKPSFILSTTDVTTTYQKWQSTTQFISPFYELPTYETKWEKDGVLKSDTTTFEALKIYNLEDCGVQGYGSCYSYEIVARIVGESLYYEMIAIDA